VTGQTASTPAAGRMAAPPREAIRISADDVFVGKDVLELLSSAMYIDPMTVYREYIQNAADAVDEAYRKGVLPAGKPGRVEIVFDAATRSVRIRDNGIGIGGRNFLRRLRRSARAESVALKQEGSAASAD